MVAHPTSKKALDITRKVKARGCGEQLSETEEEGCAKTVIDIWRLRSYRRPAPSVETGRGDVTDAVNERGQRTCCCAVLALALTVYTVAGSGANPRGQNY